MGFTLFAVQNGGECWADNAGTYGKYGPSEKCRDGKGGDHANDVYNITGKWRHLVYSVNTAFIPYSNVML